MVSNLIFNLPWCIIDNVNDILFGWVDHTHEFIDLGFYLYMIINPINSYPYRYSI